MTDESVTSAALREAYGLLFSHLGPQEWWPGDTPWEIACGAVLTQNTNWTNVERAIANLFEADSMDAPSIVEMDHAVLAELIRPAGYFNLKATRLKNLAQWWVDRQAPGGVDNLPTETLRNDLLTINGVGEETADSILLYALDRPTFVVDAYTKRFASRHGWIHDNASYAQVKAQFERAVPMSGVTYNEYHALIVALGKQWCRPKPTCSGCPLEPLL